MISKQLSVAAIFFFLLLSFTSVFLGHGFAQETVSAVEINGDHVEYLVEDNTIVAQGNVVVEKENIKLTCDQVVFYRMEKRAEAEGHVTLSSPQGQISGDRLEFNFETMQGEFEGAVITAEPYFGRGEKISKVGDNHIVMEGKTHITTCDLEKPHYRLTSKKIDVYPGDKAVARNMRMLVGNIPVLYIPKYTQNLTDQKPRVIFTPGYDKKWGMFLLTQWRYYFDENFKGTIHLDARERKDIAWGIDLDYKTKKMGDGIVRTYYMNERNITSKRFYQERPSPTIEKERFKIEWRHQWKVDPHTNAIMQYYKLSDARLLKDYFEREYEKDANPETFFLLTRTLPLGTLSFRTDVRVNRFVSTVERLPELQFNLSNQEIGQTGLYFRSVNTYSNLTKKNASPSEVRINTMRLDSFNSVSYPMKVAFLEMTPYVGGRETFYSKTKDPSNYNVIRGQLRTGVDISTKFYKIMDVQTNLWGMDVNGLRHIITPSIAYVFAPDPTVPASKLDYFDSIDGIRRAHTVTFGLENKLQTKRKEGTLDLLRWSLTSDFRLKENPTKGGFGTVSSDIDFRPTEWLTIYSDADYSAQEQQLMTANFDIYLKGKDADGKQKWTFDFGKRYTRDVDDQITTSFGYIINPKWEFKAYTRFDIDRGLLKEQEFTVIRDLHCWDMEISFNETRGQGSEIWVVFRLKAFPEIGFDFSTSFNRRKAGSQSSIGN